MGLRIPVAAMFYALLPLLFLYCYWRVTVVH